MSRDQQTRKLNNSKYYEKHKERIKLKQSLWREQNKDLLNDYYYNSRAKNPNLYRAHTSAYRRRLKVQMPLWANRKVILAFYLKAAELGLTVDHIYPLKGKLVSGLHVESNLQLLSKSENSKKFNHLPGDV